jgi:RNA polymerase sigma-70 factor (ECF subfamily)
MKSPGDVLTFPPVLLKRAVDGDDAAFTEIYTRIAGKMYSLCLRYATHTEEANDLFQDGWVKLYKNLDSYRNEGSFEGWARRIFVTTCLDAIKKKKIVFSDIDTAIDVKSDSISGLSKLSMDDLMKIIRQLPANYQTIINLYIIEDYSHKEIADMLDITENASKSQLHKARVYLKKLLQEVG